ncbi:jasmonate-induced oxygenase 3-like isoform X1 [Phragmites australis]|uniref:jasmonate-induced oxygenase 3-like isoform X1 n=1 Tax=Phragmites australis TaxID=29695 RepID=UPI002D779874|nr:jasmonate-induced oxygenase 3-like isoform X1 [Phragmites australis]
MADCMQEWSEPVVRVQALAESGLPAIPRRYVKPPCDRPVVQEQEPSDDISIPVIDLGELLADGAGLGNVTEAVAAACREWGFFQVVNHGVRPELMRAAREAWRSFFRLSVTEKQQYANSPRTYEGYGSRLGVEKGAILDWGDYYFLHLAPESAKSPAKYWPANPGNCKEVSEEYGREVVRLCELLMQVLSVSMGLDEAHFQQAFGGAECGAALRANYYPRCPQPDLTLGLSAHSDPGILTVLLADEHVRGLQVHRRGSAGEWVTVQPIRNAFIVNVGDQIQVIYRQQGLSIFEFHVGTSPRYFNVRRLLRWYNDLRALRHVLLKAFLLDLLFILLWALWGRLHWSWKKGCWMWRKLPSLEVRGMMAVHLKLVQTVMHWRPRCRPSSTGSFAEELHLEL